MTPQVLIDTAVLAYVYGGEHEYRESCRSVIALAGDGRVELHASVEMVQEFIFHRMRRTDRTTAARQAREVARLCVLHDFDQRVLEESLVLIESPETAGTDASTGPSIGGRAAVHAATAIVAGLSTIVSPDPAFDQVAQLTRIDPRDLAAVLTAS